MFGGGCGFAAMDVAHGVRKGGQVSNLRGARGAERGVCQLETGVMLAKKDPRQPLPREIFAKLSRSRLEVTEMFGHESSLKETLAEHDAGSDHQGLDGHVCVSRGGCGLCQFLEEGSRRPVFAETEFGHRLNAVSVP